MAIILTEQDSIILREHLKGVLAVGITEIVFMKKDGSIRKLSGTRDPNLIGLEEYNAKVNAVNKDGTPRKESTTSLPVFDTNINEWRTFSFENLISVGELGNLDILSKLKILA